MKEIIEVRRPGKGTSKIVVGSAITSLKAFLPDKKIFVITDANVHRRYRELIGQYEYFLAGMGETNKTLQTVEKLHRELIAAGADRSSFILGIGGGIVTDLAGFVASTYMRGVDFGFVATTLLSQVDASIGGKNGVNVDGFKNMAGTINQPDFVLCDTAMLRTLPERELRGGMAEIVKAAVIADPTLFDLLESHKFAELCSDEQLLTQAVTAAIRVKAALVEADEREGGVRKKLNLGHTFAHAIEKCSAQYTHGEAVAIGLAMICDLSVRMGSLAQPESARIKNLLAQMGLPVAPPVETKQLLKVIAKDKKCDNGRIDLIAIGNIGDCSITPMPLEDIQRFL